MDVPDGRRKLIVLEARLQGEARPFTFAGRPYQIFREDRLPVLAEALREALLNAVVHWAYSDPGSYVAIAVFDDGIEVGSAGMLPKGVSAESLSGDCPRQRPPSLLFFWAGLGEAGRLPRCPDP